MVAVRHVSLSRSPLSVDRVLAAVTDPRVGGIALFVGTIRNLDDGRAVSELDYTAHPTAPERLQTVVHETVADAGVLSVAVEHRVGRLEIGEVAIVVAVGAEHRAEAFGTCRALVDEIKSRVPIWKEQQYADGATAWVGLQ